MIDIVADNGPEEAARQVDVVTTGTFAPMCSSGAFINFGHSTPGTKAAKVLINNVPAYGGIAAVDCYIGATEPCEDDPLNKVYPGEFRYGGGHVIQDLVAGKEVYLKATAYGTDCYPSRQYEKALTLEALPQATLCNPRNAYQNYNCAVNLTNKTVYTYMGALKPRAGNANYCSAGQLSRCSTTPTTEPSAWGRGFFWGVVSAMSPGTAPSTDPVWTGPRTGTPLTPAGTLWVMGDLKQMHPDWLVGVGIQGYGCSLAVGLGVPIPILNAEMARYTAVSDAQIYTQVIDYGEDYPQGNSRSLGQVSYAQLKSGTITLEGKAVQTVPLSSMVKARQIAETLKKWIASGALNWGNLSSPYLLTDEAAAIIRQLPMHEGDNMSPALRAFVAIPIPAMVTDFVHQIQKRLDSPAVNVRWVKTGNLHLTLKFLGGCRPIVGRRDCRSNRCGCRCDGAF